MGAAPPNVLVQASVSDDPATVPSRFAGGDGATGTFTCTWISFEAALLSAPDSECTRTKNDALGEATVKDGTVPSGRLAMTSLGLRPASRTNPVAAGPTAGGVQRNVTVLPTIDDTCRPVGGCTVVGALTVSVTVARLLGPPPLLAR